MTETPSSYVETLRLFAERVYPTLAERSYYQILNIAAGADLAAVRTAFYKLAGQLHPDRFQSLGAGEVKDRLETIYARICEAYRVLASPERRAAYDKALAGGKKRLDMVERESGAPKNPEDTLKHPEAKKFFRLGMVCVSRKDWKGAVMNFNFAKNFEPGAQLIADKLAEAQAAARGGPAAPSHPNGGGSSR
jgi:DnaJ-class molecular chaperone